MSYNLFINSEDEHDPTPIPDSPSTSQVRVLQRRLQSAMAGNNRSGLFKMKKKISFQDIPMPECSFSLPSSPNRVQLIVNAFAYNKIKDRSATNKSNSEEKLIQKCNCKCEIARVTPMINR